MLSGSAHRAIHPPCLSGVLSTKLGRAVVAAAPAAPYSLDNRMLRLVTPRTVLQQHLAMPKEIKGVDYYSASEVCEAVDVSRQTLWRWRQDGLVPAGHRFRDGQLLFTIHEYEQILAHANRVEPTGLGFDPSQLPLRLGGTR